MKTILYSAGEPSGIGPDIIIQLAQSSFWEQSKATVVIISDPKLFQDRANELNLQTNIKMVNSLQELSPNQMGTLQILQITECVDTKSKRLNPANGEYVLKNLEAGIRMSMERDDCALVTGPIQKNNMSSCGVPFIGHTEYIEEITKAKNAFMMMSSEHLKVVLATTHIPLKEVAQSINKELILTVCQSTYKYLENFYHIKRPNIALLGLNPHAGESGVLGTEEIEILADAISELKSFGIDIAGPISADSAFTKSNLERFDAFIGMYHDQVLPTFKALSFGKGVNVTIGVPIIRVSVDHGTALDLAGSGHASSDSLMSAIKEANRLLSDG